MGLVRRTTATVRGSSLRRGTPMLTHLRVDNYQAIQSAELDLAPVTLIVGHNMAGKSAILRALHALCFNRTGDGFIREGEDGASVFLRAQGGRPDGTDSYQVTWTKKRGKSADYETLCWGGENSYTKTGSAVPDAIVETLKIRRIEVDPTFSIAPQFKMQHDTLLIQESGSRLARILGSLTKLDVVVKAQMSCRKDRDRAKKDKEAAEEEALRLGEQVAELDWVPDARAKIDSINETLALAAQAAEKYEKVRRLIGERQRLQAIVARRDSVLQATLKLIEADTALGFLRRAQEPAHRYPRLVAAAGRTQAIQIAKTNLRGAGEQLRELSERKEGLILSQRRRTDWGIACERLADNLTALENQQAEVNTVEMLYKTACDEAELCDHCPLREGV
jgi:DNA repair ATPase RecN